MIGIISAMPIEIAGVVGLMTDLKKENLAHIEFCAGLINGTECTVGISGPGKVNAAICAQWMISRYAPEFIINVGMAGSASPIVKVGDVVLADYVVQHDLDTTALGDAPGLVPGINTVKIECCAQINEKLRAILVSSDECVCVGPVATGDQFVSSAKKTSEIHKTFGAIACEMEAGSIGHVCAVNKTDFVAIKVISDSADTSSPADYDKFKRIVPGKIAQIVAHLIV